MARVTAALLATLFGLGGCAVAAAGEALPPQRIVSLDYCADQFVLKLADAHQIAALSPDAAKDFSYMRGAAVGFARTRPRAEEVLALRPDLVVRSYGGGLFIAPLLARAGVPVAQIGYGESFAEVRRNVRAMAAAFGNADRGEALVGAFDARLRALRPRLGLRALYMTAAGYTSGGGTLVAEILAAAGLANFIADHGWTPLPLERLAYARPDLVAAAFFGSRTNHPADWSPARHPVAQAQLRERPLVALDGAWTACGGWFVVEAVEALARGPARLEAAAP